MAVFASVDELRSAVGTDLGISDWITVTQDRIDRFAECTQDRQWIHVDPVRAADGPFGGPIAHGYLTLSLLSRFLEDLLRVEKVDAAVNYGLDRVRFPAPVPAGARVRGHGRIASVDEIPGGVQVALEVSVECEGVGKPVCVARTLARFLVGGVARGWGAAAGRCHVRVSTGVSHRPAAPSSHTRNAGGAQCAYCSGTRGRCPPCRHGRSTAVGSR